MLHCIFNAIEGMKVVEDEERQHLLSTGIWFDSPQFINDKMRNLYEKTSQPSQSGSSRKPGRPSRKTIDTSFE